MKKRPQKCRIKIGFILLFGWSISTQIVAQNCYKAAIETGGDLEYKYYRGIGMSYEEASNQVFDQLARTDSVTLDYEKFSYKVIATSERRDSVIERASIKFDQKKVYIQLLEQQYKRGQYCVLYVKIDPTATYKRKPGRLSAKHFIWRSVIPSWPQFYNREAVKGTFVIAGEITLFGAATVAFNESSNMKELSELALLTGNLANFNRYDEKRKSWRTWGNIFMGGAIVLWIYNMIDASSSPKNRYAFLNQSSNISLLASDGRLGIGIRLW